MSEFVSDDELAAAIEDALEQERIAESSIGIDEQATTEDAIAPLPTLRVVVFGSYGWPYRLAVHATLLEWSTRHMPGYRFELWTSRADAGAEQQAREFALSNGWATMMASDDELIDLDAAAVFAFVTPGSDAERIARRARRVQMFSYEPIEQQNRWSSR